MTIKVTVDATGAVICEPEKKVKGKGKDTITWEFKTPGYDFVDLKFEDPQPPDGVFTNKDVKKNKITIDDDVKVGTPAVDYSYIITVTEASKTLTKSATMTAGTRLESSGKAIIRNDPTAP